MTEQFSLFPPVPAHRVVALPPREDLISPCGRYRYWLRIPLRPPGPTCLVVMFNASTATKDQDDPTTESLKRILGRWTPGEELFGAVEIGNLHGFRSPDPKALLTVDDPVGPDNARVVMEAAQRASHVIVAWGNLVSAHADYRRRAADMLKMLREQHPVLYCLRQNSNGTPTHPLYLPATTEPAPYMETP